jgi:hypothetical protein
VYGVEAFLDIAGIESDERILSDLGAVNSFGPDLVDGALGALGGERRDAQHESQSQKHCE